MAVLAPEKITRTITPDTFRQPTLRAAPDSLPAPLPWQRWEIPASEQPQLTLDLELDDLIGQPNTNVQTGVAAWSSVPPPHLPDAQAWSRSLAQALVEALQGRRSVSQLTRWVDERVLSIVTMQVRRLRGAGAGRTQPASCQSVRLQFPSPETVEVAVRVAQGQRSTAMAFKLRAWHDRWICTALEFAPRSHA